jgi:hypothetical protein
VSLQIAEHVERAVKLAERALRRRDSAGPYKGIAFEICAGREDHARVLRALDDAALYLGSACPQGRARWLGRVDQVRRELGGSFRANSALPSLHGRAQVLDRPVLDD